VAGQAQEERLVARARDLEEDPALLLQGDLAVIEEPGYARQTEVLHQLAHGNAAMLAGRADGLDGGAHSRVPNVRRISHLRRHPGRVNH
jgi:hypothetical protein